MLSGIFIHTALKEITGTQFYMTYNFENDYYLCMEIPRHDE